MPSEVPNWLVSVDDHVLEKPTLWTERLPRRYRDVGPRIENRDGNEAWVYENRVFPTILLNATVGLDKESWSPTPINYSDLHPGCYDPAERIKHMDVAGILAQACFPSFPRFAGQLFLEAKDKHLALLAIQAWNDHMIEEWAQAFPGRFIALAMVPLWDPQLAAAEAERALAKGANAIIFSENISLLGQPSIHDVDGYWDPLFSVANESGAPICVHLGSSSRLMQTAPDAPALMGFALASLSMAAAAADFLFSGLFFDFPNLRLVLAESEIGWMPYVKMWWDHVAETQLWASREGRDFDMHTLTQRSRKRQSLAADVRPSELFNDHVYGCFINDRVGIRLIDEIGLENVMVETDYPHSDGSWPNSIKLMHEQLRELEPEDQYKILIGNAARVFNFVPAPLSP